MTVTKVAGYDGTVGCVQKIIYIAHCLILKLSETWLNRLIYFSYSHLSLKHIVLN